MTPALMVQGTGSDVGKSLIVAGLARACLRRGMAVRPFKPQNMSNNAAVTRDGGEIGRAQALQARACGLGPVIDMNPVLLKPETERGAQVIVQGRRVATMTARDYMAARARFLPAILDSYGRVADGADLVLVEGAGSPAEINLRDGDLANMGFAAAAGVPVLLVGDIHRGGVIAAIIGTLAVLPHEDAKRIRAFAINRFHGDPALFTDGAAFLERRSGLPCAGVVPHFPGAAKLPAEDALSLETTGTPGQGPLHIAVPRLSRIANFDDLDPLRLEPGVRLSIVRPGTALPGDADIVLIPGSKATIADLAVLRQQGWDLDLRAHLRRGGRVIGLCGGYQMLGRVIRDPEGIEGPPGTAEGLGLIEVDTVLTGDKTLSEVRGRHLATDADIAGYEMHLGRTEGPGRARPFARIGEQDEGAVARDGRVEGTYLHGIFAGDAFRRAWLRRAGQDGSASLAYDDEVEATLDALAGHLEAHMDIDRLLEIARGAGTPGAA